MRLIDKDRLLKKAVTIQEMDSDRYKIYEHKVVFIEDIENAPVVRPGRAEATWEPDGNGAFVCSNCGKLNYAGLTNFCPTCGARTDSQIQQQHESRVEYYKNLGRKK